MHIFTGYTIKKENCYEEDFGLCFDEFEEGQKFRHRPGITISQQDNKEESLDTINHAQLHFDQQYASHTEWKRCLCVSTMTLQKVIGMTSKTFGKKKRILGFDEITLKNPIFDGNTLYAESIILKKKKGRCLKVKTKGLDQDGKECLQATYDLLMNEKNKTEKRALEKRFASHRLDKHGFFIEQHGLFFEDLIPGEMFFHRPGKSFYEEENMLHALRSLNLNPQYFNRNVNKGKYPIEETFLISCVTALSTRTFGRVVANLSWNNIQLPLLVYAQDTIYAVSKILNKRESKSRSDQGIVHIETQAFNQKNKLVCSYERTLLIYKQKMGPYERAGY